MRKLLFVLLAVVVLGGTGTAYIWIAIERLSEARERRIAEIETRLDGLREAERLDAGQAAEHHLLSRSPRPGGRALRVTCDEPRLDVIGPDRARLSGLIYATNAENTLLGGGFTGTLCLARAADGWAVLDDDEDRSRGCQLDERWRYALVFDHDDRPPVETGIDSFYGGEFQSTLRLVDMRAGRVICARTAAFALDEKVLTTRKRSLQEIYRDRVDETLCQAVRDIGQGMLTLPPGMWCG